MNHPRMTSDGRRLAFFVGVLIACALPKRVECNFPGNECAHMVGHEQCTPYEVEPWAFYGIEYLAGRDIGFAYSHGDDCR